MGNILIIFLNFFVPFEVLYTCLVLTIDKILKLVYAVSLCSIRKLWYSL